MGKELRAPAEQSRLDWVRRLGFAKASRAVLWKLKTAASKRWMLLQERYSWYSYARWIRENEPPARPPSPTDPDFIASFLIPVSAGSLPALSATLDSLQAQTVAAWDACLIVPGDCAAQAQARLAGIKSTRSQIVVLMPGESPFDGLSRAADNLQGNWICWLESGDQLAPAALAACLDSLTHHSGADILYTDEDRLEPDGKTRGEPFFKPDWSPELLLSVNYLRGALFRREIFIPCAREGEDIDDIIYRCAERARAIVHIPRVLIHLRYGKSGPNLASERVVAHLQRLGLAGISLQVSSAGANRLTWTYEEKLISIIIPTRDHAQDLQRCIGSLLSLTRYPRLEIILVENHSQEAETLAYYAELRALPQVRIIADQRLFNYSAANNLGASQASGDWLLFLNNDIEIIEPDWLAEIARWLSLPEIGVVGARLLYPDGVLQHAGIVIGMEGHASHVFAGEAESRRSPFGSSTWYRNTSAVTGACLATRREVFDQAGGFDENYTLVFSDVEYCQQVIRQGYRVVYTPFAQLVHREGRTRKQVIPVEDIRRGAEQFYQVVKQGDPYYNPNLSYAIRVPALKRWGEEAPIDRLGKIVEYS